MKKNQVGNAEHLSDNLTNSMEDTLQHTKHRAVNVDKSLKCTTLNLQSREMDKPINTPTVSTQISQPVICVPFKIGDAKSFEEAKLKLQNAVFAAQAKIEAEQAKLKTRQIDNLIYLVLYLLVEALFL